MSGSFTTFQIGDPHQTNSLVWDRLPASERARRKAGETWSRTYEAADWRRFKFEPESYRSTFSIGHSGRLYLTRVADQRGTRVTVHSPDPEAQFICVMERGASRWAQPAGRQPFDANETTALISLGTETARLVTSDNSVRLQLCIPGSSLSRSLEAILERPIGDTVQFSNDIDWSRGGGASIRRLVCHVFAEMSEPASLLGRGIGTAEFEGLLVQSLLLGLPHNYSAPLGRQKAAAAPRNVWRAEEFLRANAKEPVTIEAVAQSAGCSVRALQLAFRRFRKTTPMEALRRIRLEEARQDIARLGGSQSVIEVAAKFGFANPGRFASQYKRAFGEYPSEALHKRSLRHSSSRRAL